MCKNRIEQKTDLRSFHLGQDILIPYSKIYAQHPRAEIKTQKTPPPHSSDTATEILN